MDLRCQLFIILLARELGLEKRRTENLEKQSNVLNMKINILS